MTMSQELDAKLDAIISRKHDLVYDMYQEEDPDLSKIEKSLMEIWDLIPLPKENWTESFRTASSLFVFYLEDLKDFNKAKAWLDKLKEIEAKIDYSLGQVLFLEGRLFYEQGKYDEALKSFKASVKEGRGLRYFEDEDPKYLDFYTHPEKHTNN